MSCLHVEGCEVSFCIKFCFQLRGDVQDDETISQDTNRMKNDVAASEEVCPQEVVGLRTKELWKSKSTTFSTAPGW